VTQILEAMGGRLGSDPVEVSADDVRRAFTNAIRVIKSHTWGA
jgi:hypothetical protein